ncbi:flagellar motor stator protein MotA [Pleionea sp. CnH1-48]|uniref:flagellar motor stator protein MotA n=1 Tax=Pleionea sp. CnH1-48 TaxID=2954494 RepID=UPI00209698FA|nr:flagellar motor stator protein MotA [Pleionea sp. CnH1-48]MCO7227427.1 flagellar motor stator protein MotA [Pleionea sp. CnH1-48]
MPVIIGAIIVLGAVLGGYVLSHGDIRSLWQPFELLIIGGAAFGAFVIANPAKVSIEAFKKSFAIIGKSHYTKIVYLELLAMLFELFSTMRREGLIAIESHIDDPKNSKIFSKYRLINKDEHVIVFICDYLRLMVIGDMTAYELENLIDAELETHHHEKMAPSHAVGSVADALPGFGIVAAVLGIVITMQALGGPPEEIGVHVAAALVGTFLGILLAYGFVGPVSTAMGHRAEEESKFYQCIKTSLIAAMNGVPPQIAVEFGRKTLYSDIRPSFEELEARVRGR